MTGLLLSALTARADIPPKSEPLPAPAQIEDRFIPYGADRTELTLAYLSEHYGPEVDSVDMVPRVIVLHWTAGGSAEGAWNTFSPERLPGRPELQAAGAVNVSAHFIVGRNGVAWRLMPETRVARHVIGLNHLAIGVENVGDN
ncbi:MAG: N-acetylmuramoyl-L-alanine amidase, partial [Myxococcota bacterium]